MEVLKNLKKYLLTEKIELVLGLGLVFLIHLKLAVVCWHGIDISFNDEGYYLNSGVNFNWFAPIKDGWVYFLWYKCLNVFIHDRVSLYLANYVIMLGLPAYFVYLVTYKASKNFVVSIVISAMFISSKINIDIWPYITKFLLSVFLLCMLLIQNLKSNDRLNREMIYFLASFVLAYIRPEYTILFFLMTSYMIFQVIVRCFRKDFQPRYITIISVFIIFFIIIGNPMTGKRSIVAFGQHFSINYLEWKNSKLDPWINWESVIDEAFPSHKSVWQMAKSNPLVFKKHLMTNLDRITRYAAVSALIPSGITAASWIEVLKQFQKMFLILFLIAGGIYLWLKKNKIEFSGLLVPFFIVSLPSIVSCVVIFPRDHYLLIPITLLLILIAAGFSRMLFIQRNTWIVMCIITMIILYMAPMTPGTLKEKYIASYRKNKSNIELIREINGLNFKGKINLLCLKGNLTYYLKGDFSITNGYFKKDPFNKFCSTNKINAIWIDKKMLEDPRFATDIEFIQFLKEYKKQEWGKYDFKNPNNGFLFYKLNH